MNIQSKTYDNLVVSLASRLVRLGAKAIEVPLEKAGISLQEFKITGLLVGEKRINQKTLASKLMVKPATLSVAIDKLERKGVLQRVPSDTDKRVNYLSLCDGIDLSEMNSLLFNVESQMLKGVSQNDLDATVKTLKEMIQNLEEQSAT